MDTHTECVCSKVMDRRDLCARLGAVVQKIVGIYHVTSAVG